MFSLIIFFLITCFMIQNSNGSSCYYYLYNHFGTKTPYRVIENKYAAPIEYLDCEPIKIWMFVRHGTRLPSKKFIRTMNSRLVELQQEIKDNSLKNGVDLDEIDFKNLEKWSQNVDIEDERFLVHEGEAELLNLAVRMQKRFPNIFPETYSNDSYLFKYTATQRTQQSAHYFAIGLFGRKTASQVWYPEALHRDPILRFYKLCAKWRKEIKKNPEAIKEQISFINGPITQNVISNISIKLGFTENLSYRDLHIMYTTCAFESSWTRTKLSPWCSIFNKETIKVMEYAQDVKYFWVDGPGYDLTYKQACPAIKNLVDHFTNEESNPKSVLYFAHSGTILKLLAHLGLYKDDVPLKHNNFEELSHRFWRVSKIDTFASNIAAILYKCGDSKKILFLHQERVVKLPGCDEELCDFNTFLNTFDESINHCNFDEMCSL